MKKTVEAQVEARPKRQLEKFETLIIVPPNLKDGDILPPIQFSLFGNSKHFYLLGRYNEDVVEFALSGEKGSQFKLSLTDSNQPYGWKVKRYGMTKTSMSKGSAKTKKLVAEIEKLEDLLEVNTKITDGEEKLEDKAKEEEEKGLEDKVDDEEEEHIDGQEQVEELQEDIFDTEDTLSVPLIMMQSSGGRGIVDAKESCIGPWSFYGPSVPEYFCRCKLSVKVYGLTKEKKPARRTKEKKPARAVKKVEHDKSAGEGEEPIPNNTGDDEVKGE